MTRAKKAEQKEQKEPTLTEMLASSRKIDEQQQSERVKIAQEIIANGRKAR